jgi:hypothetical protein
MPSISSPAPCSSATVGEGSYLQHLAAVDYPRRDRSDARTQSKRRTSEGAELRLSIIVHGLPASPQICVYSTVPSATKVVTGRQDKNPALLFDIRSRTPPACVHLHLKNPTAPCTLSVVAKTSLGLLFIRAVPNMVLYLTASGSSSIGVEFTRITPEHSENLTLLQSVPKPNPHRFRPFSRHRYCKLAPWNTFFPFGGKPCVVTGLLTFVKGSQGASAP